MKTLPEVAEELELDRVVNDPVRFLRKEIRMGRITARKIGRCYAMTAADVAAAKEAWSSRAVTLAPVVVPIEQQSGLSRASQRRRAS